jgi:hypothetical protein
MLQNRHEHSVCGLDAHANESEASADSHPSSTPSDSSSSSSGPDANQRASQDERGETSVMTRNLYLVGNDPDDRTPSGLWPSDHAGVVARLRFGQ